jgi:sulfoxide reductase heme-binding subunit YedZ
MRTFHLSVIAAAALALASIHSATAEPVKIRVGWIVAPASLVPLLFQKPELAKHYNKSYTFDPIHFASSTLQITAISQGEIDIAAFGYTSFPLAITPLRRIARFNQLVDVRRMIGVGAFVYATCHISLYVADQMFDLAKVASEIAQRVYLTIGFATLLGLFALAVTSTDGMVRRLGGRRWQRLHSIVYGLGLLALIHYFQQTKADVSVPTFVAGLFGWMIAYRLLIKFRNARAEPPTWMLLVLSVVVAVLTFIAEAVGIGIVFNASPLRVLQSAFDFDDLTMIRPGWLVLGAGLIVVAIDWVATRFRKRRPRRPIAA